MVAYFLKSEKLQTKKKKQLITVTMSSFEKKKKEIEIKVKKKKLNVSARSWNARFGAWHSQTARFLPSPHV